MDLGVGLYGRGHRRHSRLHDYFGGPHYFRNYYPISYYGSDYYYPWYGYRYASVYYDVPYAHHFPSTSVFYIDRTSEPTIIYDEPGTSAVQEIQGPEQPSAAYGPLAEPTEATLVGKGNAAFMAGSYDEARRYFVSAMLADERDGFAKFLYALTNFAQGDYQVAGLALHRALLTTADLIDYPIDVRRLYSQPVSFDAQLDALKRYVDGTPQDRGALLLLGYLHYASGQPQRALSILDRLADMDPDDTMASLLRDAVVRVSK